MVERASRQAVDEAPKISEKEAGFGAPDFNRRLVKTLHMLIDMKRRQ
jgi:hypothetical protein